MATAVKFLLLLAVACLAILMAESSSALSADLGRLSSSVWDSGGGSSPPAMENGAHNE
ncbi:hypothetical protein KSP40_PGU011049 [Platanthera guangdongensis]|uniref:Uncharacterized protein n=1 Tax=Platanthera guangdongensis TaxID=2320717 RepID=A0ABR2LK27_9ASPA